MHRRVQVLSGVRVLYLLEQELQEVVSYMTCLLRSEEGTQVEMDVQKLSEGTTYKILTVCSKGEPLVCPSCPEPK